MKFKNVVSGYHDRVKDNKKFNIVIKWAFLARQFSLNKRLLPNMCIREESFFSSIFSSVAVPCGTANHLASSMRGESIAAAG